MTHVGMNMNGERVGINVHCWSLLAAVYDLRILAMV